MVVATGSAVLAGGGLTGNWSGTWTCPGGEIPKGPLHGNINQDGDKITGQFTLVGTVKGTITGPLTGKASGGILVGDIRAGGVNIHMDGNYSGNTMSGNYSSPIGDGGYNLKR